MDMLTAAGIGPRDYARRAKSFAVMVVPSPSGKKMHVGRHSPQEYEEFEQCIRDAAQFPEKLEAAADKLLDLANLAQVIEDRTPRGRENVGHGMHILALLLMQAG